MKNMYLIIVLVLTMSFLIIPLFAVEKSPINSSSQGLKGTSSSENIAEEIKLEDLSEIRLYICESEKVLTLKKQEYVLGVVAEEMSADNNIEALKAQALAAYTFAYRKHMQNKDTNTEYDLTNDPTLDQGYLDEEARKTKWGENFTANQDKIKIEIGLCCDETERSTDQ